jgi:hypothetical protein
MSEVIPMRQQAIYTEDWIGLKELDQRQALIEKDCQGYVHGGFLRVVFAHVAITVTICSLPWSTCMMRSLCLT